MCRSLFLIAVLAGGHFQTDAVQDKAFKLSEDEQKLLDLTNAERVKNGLTAFKISPVLSEVARIHAANMAKHGRVDHELDGKKPADRIKEAGYQFAGYGENIARDRVTIPEVVAGWMNSKLHRENLLEPGFTEIGIGLARVNNGDVYYVQVFARPR